MAMTQAAVAIANGVTELQDLELPALGADDGVLHVEATGVCGSDWGYYHNLPGARGPLVLGHETVGVVAEASAEALARWRVNLGDRVCLEEYLPCGQCRFCREGLFRICDATDWRLGGLRYGSSPLSTAPGLWGGFAKHQYLHRNTVFHRVPAGVSPRHAALALPLSNGVEWAYLQGGAGPGDVVVIQGPGQQGLSCVVAAREAGVEKIIVTGKGSATDAARLALARALGADHVVNIDETDVLEAVAEHTKGEMADLVIDCASGGPESVVSAIRLARKTGRVVLGGQKRKPVPAFESDRIIANYLTVKGMRGHSYQAVELALAIIARNAQGVHRMSTHLFGLAEVDQALRTMVGEIEDGAVHCVVAP